MGKKKISKKPRAKKRSSPTSWPQRTDIFIRSYRAKYMRGQVKTQGCVFCEAAEGNADDKLCLYKDDELMVLLNKFPYNTGHLLVLPREHLGSLLNLSDEMYDHLSRLVRFSVSTLEKSYSCGGFNIGMNLGAVAGAGIPDHIHWHVVPRWSGDINFFPLIAKTKVLPESLEETYETLLPYFKSWTKDSK